LADIQDEILVILVIFRDHSPRDVLDQSQSSGMLDILRIWLDAMLKDAIALVVDWSRIDREDYLLAMERSPVRTTEIKVLLESALTDRIDERELFMKGIDASYRYEGFREKG
jgi:hypothetical protein